MTTILISFLLTITSLFLFSSPKVYADGDHGSTGTSPRIGPGKAVEAFSEENGFKLSNKARQALGVSSVKLTSAGPWRLPKSAVLKLKQSSAVYRIYDGWISLVLVHIIREENGEVSLTSVDLEPGDEVATSGVIFLRMTDTDLNAGTTDTCAH